MACTSMDYDKIQTLSPTSRLAPGSGLGTTTTSGHYGQYDRDLFEWDDNLGETSEMDQARDTLFEAMRSG